MVVVEKGSPVAGAAIEAAHEYLDKNQGAKVEVVKIISKKYMKTILREWIWFLLVLKVGEQSVVEVEAMGEAMATVNTVSRYDDCMHFHKTNPHVQTHDQFIDQLHVRPHDLPKLWCQDSFTLLQCFFSGL